MKVLLVNGSPHAKGCTYTALEEGLQTMRTLGNNMAWLMKCIALGRENGICYPEREPALRTNFIR